MKILILAIGFIMICMKSLTQTPSNDKSYTIHDIKQLMHIPWDDHIGLPYRKVPGANLAATAFQLISTGQIAFLCNSTSEIIITNTGGRLVRRFNVGFAPRDFVYDDGYFYVLTEYMVSKFDLTGTEILQITFPKDYKGVERLSRNDKSTYLILPSGNSLRIETLGYPVKPAEHQGVITGPGIFAETSLNDNFYRVRVQKADGSKYEMVLEENKKIAGAYVVGATKDKIVLDIQSFISENPINVERVLVSISIKEHEFGTILARTTFPNCSFVLSNKEVYVSLSGTIFNMISTPSGTYIFSLAESMNGNIPTNYPAEVLNLNYHFNYHLLKIEN